MEDDSDLLLLDFVEPAPPPPPPEVGVMDSLSVSAPQPPVTATKRSVDTAGIFRSMEVNDNSKTPYSDATQVSE